MKVFAKSTGCCKHILSLHLLSPLYLFFFVGVLFTQPVFTTLGPLPYKSTSNKTQKGSKEDMHTLRNPLEGAPEEIPKTMAYRCGRAVLIPPFSPSKGRSS